MQKRILTALFAAWLMTAVAFGTGPEEIFASSGAKGAALLECTSGRVLAEKNAQERLPVASTTKIMTALLVLEHGDLDTPFIVDADAIRVEGSSMGLTEGDTVTLRALLWGMLLASGNDAANAAAVRVAGSIEDFVGRMNERAAELGMDNTHFSSPSGLETGEHYSCALDMARLACRAMQNETFAEMTASSSALVSFGNPPYERRLYNHNRLLSLCEGAIGVKTGYTKAAGRCLVSAVQRGELTLVAVTLGCPDDFNVHKNLYASAFSELFYTDFTDRVSLFSTSVTGAGEQTLPLAAGEPLGAYLTSEERSQVGISFLIQPFVYAPVRQGQTLGTVLLTLDGETIASAPVVSAEERPTIIPDNRSIIERIEEFFYFPNRESFPFSIFEDREEEKSESGA